ncbi:hypothetical protein [Allosphingosinicella sp.]|jgi:hypothetical protein|uniref:hypothetical protein n=1 Tax=Allosphingosinicella sp. TaxID=2823234 RepID=UPI002EFEE609
MRVTLRQGLIWGAVAIAFAGVSTAAPPPPAPAAAPRWIVNESGAACTLGRLLVGTPAATVVVLTYPGSDEYELRLIADDWTGRIGGARQALDLTLAPGDVRYTRGPSTPLAAIEGAQVLRFADLPSGFLNAFGRAETLTVSSGGRPIASYPLRLAAPASRALAACERAKLIEWGADPAGLEPGAVRPTPIGNPDEWTGGYVMHSLRDRRFAVLRLNLAADGRPERCTILESNNGRYARRYCSKLMENARYEPARDARGNPVRSIVVHWKDWVFLTFTP